MDTYNILSQDGGDYFIIAMIKLTRTNIHNSFNWLDTGLILAVITIFGYIAVYFFQRGYLFYFGLTDIFIYQITIVNILSTITNLFF